MKFKTKNSNVWGFVWLLETKIWRKSQVMLHGYKHLCSLYKKEGIYSEIAKMLKKDWLLQIMNYADHHQTKKVSGLKKNERGGKIMTEFAILSHKKGTKKVCSKKKT